MMAYQSAKWAVGGFNEALAAEVAALGIEVPVLEPVNVSPKLRRENWHAQRGNSSPEITS